MNIFSKVSLLGTSNLPKPWRPAFLSTELATQTEWRGITYGNGKFLAKSGDYLSSSTDGVTWGTPYYVSISGFSDFSRLANLAYGNGKYIAAGWIVGSSSDLPIATSINGTNWTTVDISGDVGNHWITDIIFDGTKFIMLDSLNSNILVSSNGTNWQTQTTALSQIQKICYNGSLYVLYNFSNNVYYSPDLTNWTRAYPNINGGINIIGFDGTRFFIIFTYGGAGGGKRITYSIDGINWTTPVTDSNLGNHNWTASTTNDIKTVLISSDGYISTRRV